MQRRAPAWFTDGKVRERVHRWWPWALGTFAAAMYWANPEPLEEVRVASLANYRRPFLKAAEWIEVRDVDPESAALELPPQMIFGPLALEQQMRFVLQALREDNDLADDYVTRLVIDTMDMSLDPPRDDLFVRSGGKALLQFAVDDFTDRRPNRKRKFFGPDSFLRLLNMCAPHYELADYFVRECNGVELVFVALKDAENEYARVLATRSLTLFALLQSRDGTVERDIIRGGFLPQLVDTYRLSTGDPTDTRFSTMLISSVMRLFPRSEPVYNTLVAENLVSAVVQNLNLTRYKGVPQHLRVLQDLDNMRTRLGIDGGAYAGVAAAAPDGSEQNNSIRQLQVSKRPRTGPVTVAPEDVATVGGVPRPVMPPPRTKFQAYFAKDEPPAVMPESYRAPPPLDLHATIDQLAVDAELVPVALGVLDVFPEYFEASLEVLKWVERLVERGATTPFELLEYKGASVLMRVVGRLEKEPQFFARGGPGEVCYRLSKDIMADPECAPFARAQDPLGTLEMRTAFRNMREFMARLELDALASQQVLPDKAGITATAAAAR